MHGIDFKQLIFLGWDDYVNETRGEGKDRSNTGIDIDR